MKLIATVMWICLGSGCQDGLNLSRASMHHVAERHNCLWWYNPTTPDYGHSNHTQTGKRHRYPQTAWQPLMLVNTKESDHPGQACGKHWTQRMSHTTNPKNQHLTNTHKFGLAKCSVTISYTCSNPLGPRHLSPAQEERVSNSNTWHIWDQNLRAKQYIMQRRSHSQVTKVPGHAPHITTEYTAYSSLI